MSRVTEILAQWRRPAGAQRRARRSSVTALDLDGRWLHVVQAALRDGEPRVVRHVALPFALAEGAAPDNPDAVGRALAERLAELRLGSAPVIMGLPRAAAILRVLSLPPSATSGELASMVHFQVGRDLPFRVEDTVIDFKPLPVRPPSAETFGAPTGPGPVPVLAAVARRERVAHFSDVARAAGLTLASLGLRPLAAAAATFWCQPESRQGCIGLVSLQPGEISFDVLLDGHLVFSRVGSLPLPAPDAPESAPPFEPALLEVVRSVHDYETSPGHGRLAAFHVTGTTGLEDAVAEALENRFGTPSHRVDPSPLLKSADGNHDHPGGAVAALGLARLALESDGLGIDFLAPKNPPVVVDYRRVRRLAAVAAVLAVVLSVAGLRARLIRQRQAARDELQQQVTLASKNLAGYRSAKAQARAVEDWIRGGRQWLDHLAVLSALLPSSADLHVTSLSTTPRQSLSLTVRLRSGDIIDRLSADLRQAGFIVKPPGITPVNDRAGYRFQASLEIDAPAVVTNRLDSLAVAARSIPAPASATAPAPSIASPATAPVAPSPASADERPVRRGPRRRPEGGPRE